MSPNQVRVAGAAAAGSFVALTQLIAQDTLSASHLTAIGCFAVSLPILTTLASVRHFTNVSARDSRLASWVDQIAGWTGVVFLAGVDALFWSFGRVFGILFAFATIAACILATIAARIAPLPPE